VASFREFEEVVSVVLLLPQALDPTHRESSTTKHVFVLACRSVFRGRAVFMAERVEVASNQSPVGNPAWARTEIHNNSRGLRLENPTNFSEYPGLVHDAVEHKG